MREEEIEDIFEKIWNVLTMLCRNSSNYSEVLAIHIGELGDMILQFKEKK